LSAGGVDAASSALRPFDIGLSVVAVDVFDLLGLLFVSLSITSILMLYKEILKGVTVTQIMPLRGYLGKAIIQWPICTASTLGAGLYIKAQQMII